MHPSLESLEQYLLARYFELVGIEKSECYQAAIKFMNDSWLIEHDLELLEVKSVANFYDYCTLAVLPQERSYYLLTYYHAQLNSMAQQCKEFQNERVYHWLSDEQKEKVVRLKIALNDLIQQYSQQLKEGSCYKMDQSIIATYEPLYDDKRFMFLFKTTACPSSSLIEELPSVNDSRLTSHQAQKIRQLHDQHAQAQENTVESTGPNKPPLTTVSKIQTSNKTHRGKTQLKE